MKTRNKLAALLAAGFLVIGAYGTAFAATGASDQGVTPTEHSGNITNSGTFAQTACAADDAIDTGTGDSGSETSVNGVTVTWTYDSGTKALSFTSDGLVWVAFVKGGDGYNEYDYSGLGGVDHDGNMFAPDNGSGGPAGLSHAVFCTSGAESSSSSTSFTDSVSDTTDIPSEPNTAMIATSGSSNVSNDFWMLIAGIGVIGGSILVLLPARSKNRR
jgi:hypothetical protein